MSNTHLVKLLDELHDYIQTEADREQQLGPTWLADLSARGLDAVRELRLAALKECLNVESDFDITTLLSASWVHVHPKIDDLVAAINTEIHLRHKN